MIVQCPQCRKSYRLDDRWKDHPGGVVIKCPACQLPFTAGGPSPAPPETPAASPSGGGEPEATGAPRAASGAGRKILVADDSAFFRSMVGDILTAEGFAVMYAGDGEEALAAVRNEQPDLMILDLHLPKISGFDVIKHIRQGHMKSRLPILVISSVYTGTSHLMALEELGADDFIDKKFKPPYLVGRIRKLLEKK